MVGRLGVVLLCMLAASNPLSAGPATKAVSRVTACFTLAAPGVPDGYFWVQNTEQYKNIADFRSHLSFILRTPEKQKTVFTYATYDNLVTMYASRYSDRVVTVWESGSAIWTRIFGVSKNAVHLLLERGTHLPPEFTLNAILLNTGWVPIGERCCTADKTEIWVWTGERYRLAATVPFGQRYDALQKLPPSTWK